MKREKERGLGTRQTTSHRRDLLFPFPQNAGATLAVTDLCGDRLNGDPMFWHHLPWPVLMEGFTVGRVTDLPMEFSSHHSLDTAPIAIPIFQMNRLRHWEVRRY